MDDKTIPWDADTIPGWVRDWDRDAIRPAGGWGFGSTPAGAAGGKKGKGNDAE